MSDMFFWITSLVKCIKLRRDYVSRERFLGHAVIIWPLIAPMIFIYGLRCGDDDLLNCIFPLLICNGHHGRRRGRLSSSRVVAYQWLPWPCSSSCCNALVRESPSLGFPDVMWTYKKRATCFVSYSMICILLSFFYIHRGISCCSTTLGCLLLTEKTD